MLFHTGKNRKNMLGRFPDFSYRYNEVNNGIYTELMDKEDKIVDISSGYRFNLVVTKNGKLYGSGNYLSNCFVDGYDRLSGEITLPEGYKAIACYAGISFDEFFVSALTPTGKKVNLSGNTRTHWTSLLGIDQSSD